MCKPYRTIEEDVEYTVTYGRYSNSYGHWRHWSNFRRYFKSCMNVYLVQLKRILVRIPLIHTNSKAPHSSLAPSYLYLLVFSFDNKIDLTDSGMAKAKALRYNARKEKGEIPSREALANADPYRW